MSCDVIDCATKKRRNDRGTAAAAEELVPRPLVNGNYICTHSAGCYCYNTLFMRSAVISVFK